MEHNNYNKIVESLTIRFVETERVSILKPVTIENNYELENLLIYINRGTVKFGKTREAAHTGDIIFISGSNYIPISYGNNEETTLSKEDFLQNKEEYFARYSKKNKEKKNYTYIKFDTKVFDSVNFFAALDIRAFKIENNDKIVSLIKKINKEYSSKKVGRNKIIKIITEQIAIELIRYILNNELFVEKLATNSTYFKDQRLINIFNFIKDNLKKDLSNKILAGIANLSEDYVGQYFKMLTGTNPQDYIEYQRMEMAIKLLRTSKQSIRDIGTSVGYKDTAYFCRRFKMMFGISAGKMRKRESLINIEKEIY